MQKTWQHVSCFSRVSRIAIIRIKHLEIHHSLKNTLSPACLLFLSKWITMIRMMIKYGLLPLTVERRVFSSRAAVFVDNFTIYKIFPLHAGLLKLWWTPGSNADQINSAHTTDARARRCCKLFALFCSQDIGDCSWPLLGPQSCRTQLLSQRGMPDVAIVAQCSAANQ